MQIDYSEIELNKIRWERNGEWREADIDDLIECYEKEHYPGTIEEIKKVLADQFPYAEKGLYFYEPWYISAKFQLYGNQEQNVSVWICPAYECFIVLGLVDKQKDIIWDYYRSLKTKEVGYV